MAEEVRLCVQNGTYAGHQILSFRGVGPDVNFIFRDELPLRHFLSLSEQRKMECEDTYQATPNNILRTLAGTFGISEDFQGTYLDDYQLLENQLVQNKKTAWLDKYTTVIYNPAHPPPDYLHRQPIPDYMRWIATSELHYLPLEERLNLNKGAWDTTEELSLPSKILECCYKALPNPAPHIIPYIALLAWVSEDEVNQYLDKCETDMKEEFENDKKRDQWRQHEMYLKSRSELVELCQKRHLSDEGPKHRIVERLVIAKR
jgi:hypothetical protein